jgi:RNA polymerase sigma factor (sigma-70 family)
MADDLDSRIARLRAIFEDLPSLQRDVFQLHCFEDLPYEQIAARLSVPLETVQSSLAAALVAIDSGLDKLWVRPLPDALGDGDLL